MWALVARYLADNLDWLEENLSVFGDEDYLLIDCPGQIELYSHIPVMKRVVALLGREGFNVCAVYLVRLPSVFPRPASSPSPLTHGSHATTPLPR